MFAKMKQVEVTASNVVHLADRDIVYITRSMRKGSYNTGELLGKVPGMLYNRMTKSLSFHGDSNILILVDSLEWDEGYVKSLHHVRFDKMEIIPFPKGKYQGYDVLVNLHRIENYQGYENNGSGDATFNPGGRNVKGELLSDADWKESFTYTYNKFNAFVIYDGDFGQEERNSTSVSDYLLNDYREEVINNTDGSRNYKNYSRSHRLNGSMDYQLNKHNSLSLSYAMQWQDYDRFEPKTVVRSDLAGNVQDTIGTAATSGGGGYRHTLAGFYRGSHGAWNYTADLNYVLTDNSSEYCLDKTSGYQNVDNRHNQMNHTLARANVDRWLLDGKMYLSLGYKNLWKHYIQSRTETSETLTDYTLWQNTAWLLATYNFTRRTSLTIGPSLTTNHSESNGTCDRYLSWTAGADFMQRIGNEDWFRLVYECLSSNPNINQVTSYGQFTDSLTWSGGNPLLHSSLTHRMMLRYHFLKCLTLSVNETYQPRTFSDITTLEYGTLQSGEMGNYASTMPQNAKWNQVQVGMVFEKEINNFDLSAELMYQHTNGKYKEYKQAVGNWTCNLYASYNVEKYDLNFSLAYNNDTNYGAWAQGKNKTKMDMIWAEVDKSFLSDKLQLSFNYTLPVHFSSGKNTSLWVTPAIEAHYHNYNMNKLSSNEFQLTVSYRLFGGKSVRKYSREMSEEE